jgi:ribosomal protein S18 acetylase RimI-like enzyme
MITYKKCSEVDLIYVYEAFQAGFSDYIIKMTIPWEQFYNCFFEREGNQLEYSYIAFDEERPIGIIFSGLKIYEGILTLRCGALCVAPEYRGFGISKALFELHRQVAVNSGCKQLFLEVIVGNDRAIRFYKKLGYEKVYDLQYYTLKKALEITDSGKYEIQELEWTQILELTAGLNTHINWQNDPDYARKVTGIINYGIYQNKLLAGVLTISSSGRIYLLYTKPGFRHQGIATSLLAHASRSLKRESLQFSFPNNAALEGFVKIIGFSRNDIAEYEMYLPLNKSNNTL